LAKELLISLQEDLIEELIFLTSCSKVAFPNGDPRNLELFRDGFGHFSQTRLEFISYSSGTPALKEK
jgi:hypothetical protein